ncbi:ATP-binding protein [Acholeplasma manati]|uniref:ATP-binding protein n=1 Tax=Paracholeplasma manati TaxID=591373 RepID=A0ABT2Y3A2_9MOLU|nr:ATP-binding protein [Paracholeplasma manati]MCV2231220.1 ATP-binding protein [Paracholeplasma manati]
MAERKIRIQNYRNVGVNTPQELILNTSFSKGEMGNLVIVVGPNNSGKSNCLDALFALGTKNGISASDIPDFNNDNPKPELSLVYATDEVTLGVNKNLVDNNNAIDSYFYSSKDKKINNHKNELTASPSPEARKLALWIITFNNHNGLLNRIPQNYHDMARKIVNEQKFNDNYELLDKVHKANTANWGPDYVRTYYDQMMKPDRANSLVEEFKPSIPSIPTEIIEWQEKNKLDVMPNIIRFKEEVTSHSQLTITPDQVKTSNFYLTLFAAIDYNVEELVNCYSKAKQQSLFGLLKKTQKDINTKLDEVTKQFNKLFYSKEKKYSFEISLEKESIYLSIYMDEIALHLDKQSAGFRWFFNFYFTVIAQTKLKRGDIIIMDEPATNLHMQGVQELRKFMKEYAKKTELTFVVSTHIPFFIDIDYLEEIRVVSRQGDGAVIDNKFHAIGGQETDALKPIKDALTVGRHVLYDQGSTHTIFVEGITDYCYLSAFKLLNKIENIVFLPIQGVKKSGIIETLLKIEKLPTILVDGDAAGLDFQKKHKDRKNVEIISLADVNPNWKTIEDLFSLEDKQKTKYFNDCVAFKNRLSLAKLSKETKDNFKSLLDHISL